MRATGIIRRFDDLGRIVIPKVIRKELKFEAEQPMEIFVTKEGGVMLLPYRPE